MSGKYRGYPVVARAGEVLVLDLFERDGDADHYVLTSLDCADGVEFGSEHVEDMLTALRTTAEHVEAIEERRDPEDRR